MWIVDPWKSNFVFYYQLLQVVGAEEKLKYTVQ